MNNSAVPMQGKNASETHHGQAVGRFHVASSQALGHHLKDVVGAVGGGEHALDFVVGQRGELLHECKSR